MRTLRLAAALVALLLLPVATAEPAEGALHVQGALLLPQGAALDAQGGAFFWQGDALPALVLHADALDVRRVGERSTVQQTPLGGVQVAHSDLRSDARHAAATLTLAPGQGAQLVALQGGGAFALAAEGATLRAVEGVELGSLVGPEPAGCAHDDCIMVHDAYELAAAGAATLSGDLTLLLFGPVATVRDASGETAYASGPVESSTATATVNETAWVRVHATGATLTLSAPEGARWYAATGELSAPEASVGSATGGLRLGLREYRAHEEAVALAGALVLTPDLRPAGGTHSAAAGFGEARYADAFSLAVAGDVRSISLRAVPVYESPAQAGGLLALLALLGGALAWSWPRLSFAAAALYTRLRKPDLLDNGVRSQIFEIVRQSPGISARAVHRASGQSWGTVVYHLRQLERHHLVVSRALGRTRNYYENHGKYRGMEVQLACLRNERARMIARAVLAAPGSAQEDLVGATGLPQPAASYYVRKLKQAGLVEERREGRYSRYHPHADLARFVQLAEAADAGAPAAEPAPGGADA